MAERSLFNYPMRNIHLENDKLTVRPIGTADISRQKQLIEEIYSMPSDDETLQYIPEKRLHSITEAQNWLGSTLLNIHCGRNQTHLITSKKSSKLLGIIDLIPPSVAREHYCLKRYPHFIEFYLNSSAKGKALMSALLPKVISGLKSNGVAELAAVVNRKNIAASKVLLKAGFKLVNSFDEKQDMYAISA
ncbi:GNAT family N-acetyltransferase [Mucilaginibacter terrae]|uniref:Ribosomal-protein-alanine N-acetyltransferase n=1 Tax=Mucilaginibacter terrae TaxID=1955052 RepID=A0ABU3GQU1_9SPHI|nr:GNAT family N-acetyltransferase [Mucilaginibacter terrae]MDT3401015.1 ribosomal-protein-alanine N-acetyltransferase [Mucilaginibacter terrae]